MCAISEIIILNSALVVDNSLLKLLQTLREMWKAGIVQKMDKVHELRTKTSKTRKTYGDLKGHDEGLLGRFEG